MKKEETMPVHDWPSASQGTFHHFHTLWIAHLSEQLNRLLPPNYYAMAEQHMGTGIGDVVTLTVGEEDEPEYSAGTASGTMTVSSAAKAGIRIVDSPPRVARHLILDDSSDVSERARRIVVRTQDDHRVIAIVEIVSPGNKDNRYRLQAFVEKIVQTIRQGIHVLLIDLLPPGKLDPQGLHNEIWQALGSDHTEFLAELPLTLASYFARSEGPEAFVEPTTPGRTLIPMPLFLEYDRYIEVPLEDSYQQAWQGVPARLRPD
jgi:hypothetical protein